jgi:hypothetical protein
LSFDGSANFRVIDGLIEVREICLKASTLETVKGKCQPVQTVYLTPACTIHGALHAMLSPEIQKIIIETSDYRSHCSGLMNEHALDQFEFV